VLRRKASTLNARCSSLAADLDRLGVEAPRLSLTPAGFIHTALNLEYRPGRVAVLSYRDYFNQYRRHPEAKALDPKDQKPCHTWTKGLLRPWKLTAQEALIRVGKESNRIADPDQPINDQTDAVIEYPAHTRKCRGCDETVSGRRQWCSEACRKKHSRRTPQGRSSVTSRFHG
jgi:hypothetical protein